MKYAEKDLRQYLGKKVQVSGTRKEEHNRDGVGFSYTGTLVQYKPHKYGVSYHGSGRQMELGIFRTSEIEHIIIVS